MSISNISRARQLRRNLTDAERRLWSKLRSRQLAGVKFRRQEPIGRYVADFCCVEHRLIVEVDGGHHAEERQKEYDRERTMYLERCGYRVLRFWNTEVLGELDGVLEMIWEEIVGSPHPDPLPEGEGTIVEPAGIRKPR